MKNILKPKEMAELLGVSVKTLQFGYDWFERLLKKQGTEIIVVKNEKFSPSEELTQDLISIIHVFSCRIYGLRKYKNKIRKDDEL